MIRFQEENNCTKFYERFHLLLWNEFFQDAFVELDRELIKLHFYLKFSMEAEIEVSDLRQISFEFLFEHIEWVIDKYQHLNLFISYAEGKLKIHLTQTIGQSFLSNARHDRGMRTHLYISINRNIFTCFFLFPFCSKLHEMSLNWFGRSEAEENEKFFFYYSPSAMSISRGTGSKV